jgi:hypothetical protein
MTFDEWLYLSDVCAEFEAIRNSKYHVLVVRVGPADSSGTVLHVDEVLRGSLEPGSYLTQSRISAYEVIGPPNICSVSVRFSEGDTLIVLGEVKSGKLRIPGVGSYPYSAARRDSALKVISETTPRR